MVESSPSFLARLVTALGACARVLTDPDTASAVARLLGRAPGEPVAEAPPAQVPALSRAEPNAALQLLGLLQQEGRLIDFLQEDVAAFSDAEVGAAARVIHEGCRKALAEHFTIEPVRAETEGANITLQAGFDSSAVRLTGNVLGQAPFTGTLTHRGWRATETRLPQVADGHDLAILAPAEVDL